MRMNKLLTTMLLTFVSALSLTTGCDWHPTTPDARFETGAKVTTFSEEGDVLGVYTGRVKYMRNGDLLMVPCDQTGEVTIQQPFEIRFGSYCR